jgi:thiol-disulfide isomerase/thioredoxin
MINLREGCSPAKFSYMKFPALALLLVLPSLLHAQLSIQQVLDSSAKYYNNVKHADVYYLHNNKNLLKSVIDTLHRHFQYTNSSNNRKGVTRTIGQSDYQFFIDKNAYYVNSVNSVYSLGTMESDEVLEQIPYWNRNFFKNVKSGVNSSSKIDSSNRKEYKISFADNTFRYLLAIDKINYTVNKYSVSTFDKKYGLQMHEWVFFPIVSIDTEDKVLKAIDSARTNFAFAEYSAKDNEKSNSIIRQSIVNSKVDLSEVFIRHPGLKSKYILLDFFHQACLPCVKSIPDLNSLMSDFDPSELVIFGVDPMLEDVKSTPSFASRFKVNFEIIDGEYALHLKSAILNTYHVAYPTYVLLTGDGIILEIFDGYSKKHFKDLRNELKKGVNK